MEDSWRFRPIQGNICPTCSTSHFPFCSQPPQFDRNGFGIGGHVHRNPNNPSYQRPFFDPYLDNNRMMIPRPPPLHYDDRVNPIPPMYGNPSDFYKTQRSWNGNHSLEMGSSNQFPQPPLMADSGAFSRDGFHDYAGFMRGEYSESDRIHKRMKFDEMGSGSFAQISAPVGGGDYPSNPKQMSEEDERRLSLIREHGRSAVNSHGGLESRRSEWLTGTLNNKGTNQYHLSGSEQSLDFAQQQLQDKPNGFHIDADQSLYVNKAHNQKLQHSDYGQNNSTLHASPQSHGHSNVQTGSPNFMNHNVQSQASSAREQSFLTGPKDDVCHQPNVPRRAPHPISQASSEEYRVHDFQQLQSGKNDPSKDNTYPHLTKWQACVNSNDVHYQGQHNVVNQSFEVQKQGCYLPPFTGNGIASTRQGQITVAQPFGIRPPLPPLPPPPFPMEPSGPPPPQPHDTSSVHKPSPSIYPIPSSSVSMPLLNVSARETQSFPPKHPSPEKPRIIDASLLLRRPHRFSRPDHIVVILRGLPGSGKSYLAKMIRDLEVENGGKAPRIHSMDDYFMTEVEKVEERDTSKSSTSVKGKRQITKKVMEYCYEPEMEEAYRLSMLKAFKKNLDEGSFTFIIVDDRNLRVADFAQFWASAKRSGYEVYLLEATYKDPAGCAARNVHGFTSDDIKGMAELWEEAPSLYLQLDVQSLFQGDGLDENGIQEVDMDTEDASCDEHLSGLYAGESLKKKELPVEDYAPEGSFKKGERWDTEESDSTGVNELGKSKWSQDVDEEETEKCVGAKQNSNALSGLIQAYNKGDKTVHWADQVGKTGFSIGGTKKANMLSLVIGPGAGYNMKSNPLLEEDKLGQAAGSSWESNKRTVFQEHLRAERESFKAVFDRRRQRIGLQADDE